MLLTVFTPIYNRTHTLGLVYECIRRQHSKDFEWLVIDDGSTDNTEELVTDLSSKADFPIRYFKKENGGKYTACNLALDRAGGQLFFVLDSDDTIPDDFMETVSELNADMAGDDSIGGAVALISDKSYNLRGASFPNGLRTTLMTLVRKEYVGEYVFIFKTCVAKRFRFPVIGRKNTCRCGSYMTCLKIISFSPSTKSSPYANISTTVSATAPIVIL